MTEKELLSGLIKEYCAELDAAGASAYDDYVFSKKYMRRKRQAIKISKGHHGNIIRRSTLFIIAAAILLAGCGIAYAFEPLRSFIVQTHRGSQMLAPDPKTAEHRNNSKQMEDEYIIDIPEGYSLVFEDLVHGYTHYGHTYKNENGSIICFDQYRNDVFKTYYPNESDFVKRTDKNGSEVLVVYSPEAELYWNTGEYTLKLSGGLSENELMEIYYTARLKE